MPIHNIVAARPILSRAGARAVTLAAALAGLSACAPALDAALDAASSFPNPIAVVAAPFAPPQEPGALVGHSGREVAGWLGEPQLKRRDPPAEMWQYRTQACVVDFFLYGDALAVSHVEMRPREASARACLSAIRANGRSASGG